MRLKAIVTLLLMLLLAAVGQAQTKISGTAVCGKPDVHHMIDVGDRPGHSVMISQIKCKWSKPAEVGGVQDTEGVSTPVQDIRGNSANTIGYYVDSMANGDKLFVHYHGKTALKDGQLESDEGSWTYTGGTGKFKGIKGKGTYNGKAGPEGVTYEVEGEYELPK